MSRDREAPARGFRPGHSGSPPPASPAQLSTCGYLTRPSNPPGQHPASTRPAAEAGGFDHATDGQLRARPARPNGTPEASATETTTRAEPGCGAPDQPTPGGCRYSAAPPCPPSMLRSPAPCCWCAGVVVAAAGGERNRRGLPPVTAAALSAQNRRARCPVSALPSGASRAAPAGHTCHDPGYLDQTREERLTPAST